MAICMFPPGDNIGGWALELLSQCRTNKLSGHLACALVDLQVVTNADGLTQLKPDDLGRNKTVSAQEALRFRRIIILLRNSGVEL